MALLDIANLTTRFHTRNGIVRAVEEVSLSVREKEFVGIVGESGSGKSVLCLSLLKLISQPPGRISADSVRFDGEDLLHCNERRMQTIRGNRIAMIFQSPMTSLNPYMRIGTQLTEPLLIHGLCTPAQAQQRALAAFHETGLRDAEHRLRQYPHELSGGMRQRIMIAMALITNPRLLIADEPTTALDVTVQAQICEVLKKMRSTHGSAVLFVTHDLGVVAGLCDRIVVMYAGRIVESGDIHEVFRSPKHPYSEALRKSTPWYRNRGNALFTIPGSPPDPVRPITGCPFQPRCRYRDPVCHEPVALHTIGNGTSHCSACTRVQRGELRLGEAGGECGDESRKGNGSHHG